MKVTETKLRDEQPRYSWICCCTGTQRQQENGSNEMKIPYGVTRRHKSIYNSKNYYYYGNSLTA